MKDNSNSAISVVLMMIAIVGGLFFGCAKSSDKDLYLNFRKEVIKSSAAIDEKYRPYGEACVEGKTFQAVSIAREIEPDLRSLWQALKDVPVPELDNAETQKELQTAKDIIVSAYVNKYKLVYNVVKFADNPPSTIVQQTEKNGQDFQRQAVLGMVALNMVADKLGIAPEQAK